MTDGMRDHWRITVITLLAAWLGATIIVGAVVAPAAFAVLPSRTLAGALVGRVLPPLFWSGVAVGFVAGLIPCPLTLFAMFFALSRGIPVAGLVFATAMMLGVLFTLAVVAGLTIVARDRLTRFIAHHGGSMLLLARALDGVSGVLLIILSVAELRH